MDAVKRVAIAAALTVGMTAAPARAEVISSSFSQLAGNAGCFTQAGETEPYYGSEALQRCTRGNGLDAVTAAVVSPDQKHVYAVSTGFSRAGSNALVAFSRDGSTGALTSIGCVSDDGGDGRIGSDGLCADGDALSGANDVAISPDGRNVYVASVASNGVSTFTRDPETGAVTQLECKKASPRGDGCEGTPGLLGANGIAVSPDGKNVYVSSGVSDAAVAFSRDEATGALTYRGCVSATGDDGACVDGTALQGASSVEVSPDNTYVYVTARETGAVTWYTREAETGMLVPAGCVLGNAPQGGRCVSAAGLTGAVSLAIAPDGDDVYVTAGGLLSFDRDPATGSLTQSGCLVNASPEGDDDLYAEQNDEEEPIDEEDSDDDDAEEEEDEFARSAQAAGTCTGARAIDSLTEVTVSPDGRSVFAVGSGSLTAFDRDAATGALKQVGCAQEYRTYKSCNEATGLYGASAIAASNDGRSLYVTGRTANTIAVFGASVAIRRAARTISSHGYAKVRIACPKARRAGCRGKLTYGRRFVLKRGEKRVVNVRIPARMRRSTGRRVVRVTIRATDGRRVTRASASRLTFRR